MAQVRYTEIAREDLRAIHNYIAADNPAAARKMVASIRSLVRKLADYPNMGRRRDELVTGMRSFPRGNYIVFFTLDRSQLCVLRILHGAQDIGHDHFLQ
jgi:toxin ParE1/3/4